MALSDNLLYEIGCIFQHSEHSKINLKNNEICKLSSCAFTDSRSLSVLDLSHNKIVEYSVGAFDGLTSLSELLLDSNALHTIHDNSFIDLSNLRMLQLGFNKICQIEPLAFQGLDNLAVLNLEHNRLQSITSTIGLQNTENLTELNFSNNCIYHADLEFLVNASHLRVLDLSYNKIQSIHIDLSNKQNVLNILNLSHNQLIEINDASFKSFNAIGGVMDLSNNLLRSFPKFTSTTGQLGQLDLSNNPIRRIKVESQINATEINLSNGLVGVLNLGCFLNLFPRARQIHIISTHPNKTFRRVVPISCYNNSAISDVIELTAHQIGLKTFNFAQETHLPKLKYLDVAHNRIRSIPVNLAISLPALLYLNVSFNKIVECDANALIMSLTRLDLRSNPVLDNNASEFSTFSVKGNEVRIRDIASVHSLKRFVKLDNSILRLVENRIDCLCYLNLSKLRISKLLARHGTISSTKGLIITGVTEIDLSYNRLESFEYVFEDNDNPNQQTLIKLDLTGNNLKELHFPFALSSLEILRVDLNSLEAIDFAGIPSIKKLRASNNRFKQLDITIAPNLTVIDLSNNLLNYITVTSMHHLKLLNLDYNQFNQHDNIAVDVPTNVSELSLNHNKFTEWSRPNRNAINISMTNHHLKALDFRAFQIPIQPYSAITGKPVARVYLPIHNEHRRIDFSNGDIATVSDYAFEGCEHLQELFLTNNALQKFDLTAIESIMKLNILSLARNRMKSIDFPYIELDALTTLDISGNELNSLDRTILENLPQLTHLDISSNEFNSFDGTIVEYLPHLEHLNISRNKLRSLVLSIDTYQRLTADSLITNPLSEIGVVFGKTLDKDSLGDSLLDQEFNLTNRSIRITSYTDGKCVTSMEAQLGLGYTPSLYAVLQKDVGRIMTSQLNPDLCRLECY